MGYQKNRALVVLFLCVPQFVCVAFEGNVYTKYFSLSSFKGASRKKFSVSSDSLDEDQIMLPIAIKQNDLESVSSLLERNDYSLDDYDAMLSFAIKFDADKIVELLLNFDKSGASVSNKFAHRVSRVDSFTTRSKSADSDSKLASSKKDFSFGSEDSSIKLKHDAAQHNSAKVMQLLIHMNGVGVAHLDRDQISPLHIASFHRSEETVDILLTHGFDPNQKTKYGETPLDVVCDAKTRAIMKKLISAGAHTNLLDEVYNHAKPQESDALVVVKKNKASCHYCNIS